MDRKLTYIIDNQHNGCTIESYLIWREFSRHIITHLKRTPDGILLNGTWARTRETLKTGDQLDIQILESEPSPNIIPVPMKLNIVYEDQDLLVIDKPADMPIHPSQNNYDNTLANGLADYFQQKGAPFVYRCMNRLDRDTTGLLIIAANMLSAAILSSQVKKHEIHREYMAIASGLVPESGIIDVPIGRMPGSTIERIVDFKEGQPARTNYRRIDFHGNYSLVSLKLDTGRTHQIRVHMKSIGHPLIGDYIYNPDDDSMKRQALHSCRLQFIHPITKGQMIFHSPLPDDMASFFPRYSGSDFL